MLIQQTYSTLFTKGRCLLIFHDFVFIRLLFFNVPRIYFLLISMTSIQILSVVQVNCLLDFFCFLFSLYTTKELHAFTTYHALIKAIILTIAIFLIFSFGRYCKKGLTATLHATHLCLFLIAYSIRFQFCQSSRSATSVLSSGVLFFHPWHPFVISVFQVRWQRGLFRFLVCYCSVHFYYSWKKTSLLAKNRLCCCCVVGGGN